jgi:hypothetical protein
MITITVRPPAARPIASRPPRTSPARRCPRGCQRKIVSPAERHRRGILEKHVVVGPALYQEITERTALTATPGRDCAHARNHQMSGESARG